jgi:hypothetical protein
MRKHWGVANMRQRMRLVVTDAEVLHFAVAQVAARHDVKLACRK